MTALWVTLLIGLGVMFGMLALVVDVGFGMSQIRGMQNGADAGSVAAAKLAASSISAGPGGAIVYLISNDDVHNKAVEFAALNRPASLTGATYRQAVEYRPCPGESSGSPNFSNQSDADLMAEVQAITGVTATKQGSGSDLLPSWTCALRVFTRVNHQSFFAATMGKPATTETARATARIFPTSPPTVFGKIWPITRWVCNGLDDPATTNKDEGQTMNDITSDGTDKCDDEEFTNANNPNGLPCVQNPSSGLRPCQFWDSNSDPNGRFKGYLDMSRFSGLAKGQGIKRAQMLRGWADACDTVGPSYCAPDHKYDPANTGSSPEPNGGNNDKNDDVPYWLRHGWNGEVIADPDDCVGTSEWPNPNFANAAALGAVTDPNQCHNSRLEIFEGDLGNNLAEAMEDYLDDHIAGRSQICGHSGADNDFANVVVFTWRWAEQDSTRDSLALTNAGKLWGYYGSNAASLGIGNPQPNDIKRVILHRGLTFRFCRGDINNSNIRGYFVSFLTNLPPTEGPPSPIANTVLLVE
jgi:hypothetical protein